MENFTAKAPIRKKLYIVAVLMTALVALGVLVAALLPLYLGLPAGALVVGFAWVLAMRFREAICVPYVTTVVRMEGLAAGDLDSSINYTDFEDCVGRMTKAMFTFRDTAKAQLATAAEQEAMIREFTTQLQRLADGDLTASITADLAGDYLTLKTNFNNAMSNLRDLVGSVQEAVETIRAGSGEIAQASENLARRTEANAASLEETAAAVTSMNERLKATAGAAEETVSEADKVIHVVGTGRSVAEQAVQAMGRVSESAKGIDDVIEGLDKIAFQTRVLAMNAAVEAGRAGEAGRGFAVVADLVSALAMRAEEEAKRAREQLTITQTEVGSAVDAVQSVDTALDDIVDGVQKVHGLLGRIAEDNRSQSHAITEVTTAVDSMDSATQQNAAMVEETSAAACSLATEVEGLGEQAGRFRIEGIAMARPRPIAHRPKAMPELARKPSSMVRPHVIASAQAHPVNAEWDSF